MAFASFTVDLYLPSLPSVGATFGVDAGIAQLTLGSTALGLAVGQLVVGAWSDVVGRRRPLIVAAFSYTVFALVASSAWSIEVLIICRCVMGIAAAAGTVVSLAAMRDLVSGLPMIRMLARLSAVSGIAPLAAPILGSLLLHLATWRGVFVALAVYAALAGTAVYFFVAESLPVERRVRFAPRAYVGRVSHLLSQRHFTGVVVIAGLGWGGMYAHLATSPFLVTTYLGLEPTQYGPLFALFAAGFVGSIQVSAHLSRTFGPVHMLGVGLSGQVAGGLVVAAFSAFDAPAPLFVVGIALYVASIGLCLPATQVLALAENSEFAGTAASLLGVGSYAMAGLSTTVVGLLGVNSAGELSTLLLVMAVGAVGVLVLLVRPGSVAITVR